MVTSSLLFLHWEVESNYPILESGLALRLCWPTKCDRSDILEFLRPGHKKLCIFQVNILDWSLWGKPAPTEVHPTCNQSCEEATWREIFPCSYCSRPSPVTRQAWRSHAVASALSDVTRRRTPLCCLMLSRLDEQVPCTLIAVQRF